MRADRIAGELLLRHRRAREASRHWSARASTDASVIRVFAQGTKPALLYRLVRLPVEELGALRSKEGFERWFVSRVKPWLFVPVDSYMIRKLKSCGVKPPYSKIKEIATRRAFYFVQNLLAERCGGGVSRIVFDDSWADRD